MYDLTEQQRHALGVIAGTAFGLARPQLRARAKELIALGLVQTDGAFYGQNRSHYRWTLTKEGRAFVRTLVLSGAYPLAKHTSAGREFLGAKD